MKKDFLTIADLKPDEILGIIKRAIALKKDKNCKSALKGKVLGLVFEKESTRTRISFEVAMARLGGTAIYISPQSSQLSRGESYIDTARVLSRYLDVVVLRTFSQKNVEEFAANATIPVINGLTDLCHPCQVLSDLMTIYEKKGELKKLKIAYVGDGNNMAYSWIEAALLLGLSLRMACPTGYWPEGDIVSRIPKSSSVKLTENPVEAVKDCDVINTDTWFSMGQKAVTDKKKAFKSFQVNKELVGNASSDAIILHCLPAHRGEEITDEVMDGPQSVILEQAENRLYVQMALLEALMGKNNGAGNRK